MKDYAEEIRQEGPEADHLPLNGEHSEQIQDEAQPLFGSEAGQTVVSNLEFPQDYSAHDLSNVFSRLQMYDEQKKKMNMSVNNESKMLMISKTGNQRSQMLYQDSLVRKQRQQVLESLPQNTNQHRVNMKNRLIAYNKLEKDIDKAIEYVTANRNQMELAELSKLLNLMNIFKILPGTAKTQEKAGKMKMLETREEDLLFQIWYLLNPLMTRTVSTKIIGDFVKLIFDPYMSKEGEHYQQRVDLILEYVVELKRISKIEERAMGAGTSKLQKYYQE